MEWQDAIKKNGNISDRLGLTDGSGNYIFIIEDGGKFQVYRYDRSTGEQGSHMAEFSIELVIERLKKGSWKLFPLTQRKRTKL